MAENSDALWRNLSSGIEKMQGAIKIRLNYVMSLSWFFCFGVAKAIFWSFSTSITYWRHIPWNVMARMKTGGVIRKGASHCSGTSVSGWWVIVVCSSYLALLLFLFLSTFHDTYYYCCYYQYYSLLCFDYLAVFTSIPEFPFPVPPWGRAEEQWRSSSVVLTCQLGLNLNTCVFRWCWVKKAGCLWMLLHRTVNTPRIPGMSWASFCFLAMWASSQCRKRLSLAPCGMGYRLLLPNTVRK